MKHKGIEEAKSILTDLENEIKKDRKIWLQIEKDNPGFEQVSPENWERKEAQCLIHGATELSETNELDRWLFTRPPLSNTAQEKASKCIKHWKTWLEMTNNYYGVFDEFEVVKPLKNETLYYYINRVALLVENEGKGARLEWRALKSFLAYMMFRVRPDIRTSGHPDI
jgi:hypothetical protein